MEAISANDRAILRRLAAKQAELAHSPANLRRVTQWKEHNAFRGEKPLIHLELWTFQQEVIEPRLQCEGKEARGIETQLYRHFLNQELFDDDMLTPDHFPVQWQTYFQPLGLDEQITHVADGGLGHHFDPVINDLEDDFGKFASARWSVDREGTQRRMDLLSELFGDILPVKLTMNCLYSVPTQKVVHLMGMENMLLSMYDYPELFHAMMNRYAEDTLAYYRFLEQERLLLPTVEGEGLGQGTLCFTEELPGAEEFARRPFVTTDVWGFMDSQETVGVSPQMIAEFIFPYYKRIAGQYGLLSYGCCEPVHPIWDECLSQLPNLRKVSISPWCDEAFMGERLRGTRVMFHRKPSPNYLGVGATLDEEAFRGHIRASLLAARGCKMEITQRDVYTINHDIPKAKRYVELIREEIEKHWK